jgi:WD40 repeat protein
MLQLTDADFFMRAAFSLDGRYIATASAGAGGAWLWDSTTGKLIRDFGSETGVMQSVSFSPDDKYLLTGGDDGIARIWTVETGEEIRQFVGHTDVVYSAVFSPDGKIIATASVDTTVRLWDTQTGQEIRRLIGHSAPVENVVFSPDGKYLLTGSDDGTARLWDVDYHTTMDYLCSRLLRDFTDEERAQFGITDDEPTCPARQ